MRSSWTRQEQQLVAIGDCQGISYYFTISSPTQLYLPSNFATYNTLNSKLCNTVLYLENCCCPCPRWLAAAWAAAATKFLLARTSRLQQLTTCRLASKLDNLFAKTRFNLFARVRSLYLNCLWMMPTPKHARAQKNLAENLKKDLKKDLIFWPRSFLIFQITPRSDPFFKKGSRSLKRSWVIWVSDLLIF